MNSADQTPDQPCGSAPPPGLDTAFTAADLYILRATVAAHATGFGLSDPRLGRLLVIATELATNAIRHGGGAGRLRLWQADGAIFCQVSDDGPGIADPAAVGARRVPLSQFDGRGLWVVRQFGDEVTITDNHPGAVITVRIDA